MNIRIAEIHAADSPKALNTEWFVFENTGDSSFSTKNCTLSTGRGKKLKQWGAMDPGFTLGPGERVRVHSGNPGKKAHGKIPDDGVRTYNLFLGARTVLGAGTVVELSLRSLVLVRATFDPESKTGVAADNN